MSKLSDFDLDLSFGQEGESLVQELLTGGHTVEVKRDRKWKSTGNVYVETECFYNRTNSWGPSGINVTKADYWAFVLEEGIFFMPTDAVRYAVEQLGRYTECNIPPNPSKGILLTLTDLARALKEYKE
jgi:hypothetical protein